MNCSSYFHHRCFTRIIYFGLLVFTSACNHQPVTFSEYKLWFSDPDNGFVKKKEINDLVFSVQYRPVDYQLVSELKEYEEYTQIALDSIRHSYAGGKYFLLEVGTKNKEVNDMVMTRSLQNFEDFKEMVHHAAFGLNHNVSLIADGDTIKPSLYHFERGYELGRRARFLFAFPVANSKSIETMTFCYDDVFFNSHRLNFRFKKSDMNMPELPVQINNTKAVAVNE